MVRFAHDPRCRQVAMLEDDRFEVLDITVRAESELADKAFKDLPATGSVIGAVVRDGTALFPHGTDILRAGDRVIIFVESRRAAIVKRALRHGAPAMRRHQRELQARADEVDRRGGERAERPHLPARQLPTAARPRQRDRPPRASEALPRAHRSSARSSDSIRASAPCASRLIAPNAGRARPR